MKKGVLFAALTALLFSLLEPVSKLVANEIDPFFLTALRFLIGAVFLLPFSVSEIKRLRPTPKELAWTALTGLLMVCVSMPLLQISIQRSDSPALIAIIFSGNSLFTVILSALALKEVLRLPQLAAVALCMLGIVICALPFDGGGLAPAGLAILSALTFSLYTILSKKHLSRLSGSVSITLSFFMGGSALMLMLLAAQRPLQLTLSSNQLLCVLCLGVVVTGMGYLAYFQAMRLGGAHTAAFSFFIKPVLAPLTAYLIGGSLPSANVFLAIPLIVAGAVLNAVSDRKLPSSMPSIPSKEPQQ